MNKQKNYLRTRMKHSSSLIEKFILLLLFVILLPMGCTAKNPKKVKVKKVAKIEVVDSTARNVVNDSVYTILMNGKIKSMQIDSNGKCSEMKYLAREDCHLLRFLITDPNLYLGDIKVYGKIMPCIRFEFQKTKNEIIYVNLDFGLGKWTLTNMSGKVLYRSSLSTYDILRFSHELYPQNELIKNQYKLKVK